MFLLYFQSPKHWRRMRSRPMKRTVLQISYLASYVIVLYDIWQWIIICALKNTSNVRSVYITPLMIVGLFLLRSVVFGLTHNFDDEFSKKLLTFYMFYIFFKTEVSTKNNWKHVVAASHEKKIMLFCIKRTLAFIIVYKNKRIPANISIAKNCIQT